MGEESGESLSTGKKRQLQE